MRGHKQLRLGTLAVAAIMLLFSGCVADKERSGDVVLSADNSTDTYSDTSSEDLPLDSSISSTSEGLMPTDTSSSSSTDSQVSPMPLLSSKINELYSDYYIDYSEIYYVNISDDQSWQGVEFTVGDYFGQVLYNTDSRELSSIQPGSANVLPIGTELYESNERKTVILAKMDNCFIPYVKIVEG